MLYNTQYKIRFVNFIYLYFCSAYEESEANIMAPLLILRQWQTGTETMEHLIIICAYNADYRRKFDYSYAIFISTYNVNNVKHQY